jgi:hypothetical protein
MPATHAMIIDMLLEVTLFSDLHKDRTGVRPGEAALDRMVDRVLEISQEGTSLSVEDMCHEAVSRWLAEVDAFEEVDEEDSGPEFYEAHVTVTRGTLQSDGVPFHLLSKIIMPLRHFQSAILDNVRMGEEYVDGDVVWAEPFRYEPVIEIRSDERMERAWGLEQGTHFIHLYLDVPKTLMDWTTPVLEAVDMLARYLDEEHRFDDESFMTNGDCRYIIG